MGQLRRQLLDLQLSQLEFGIALCELEFQGEKLRMGPFQQRRLSIALYQFKVGIYFLNYTICMSRCLVDIDFQGRCLVRTRHSPRGLTAGVACQFHRPTTATRWGSGCGPCPCSGTRPRAPGAAAGHMARRRFRPT